MKKLYVGNLSWAVSNEQLKDFFSSVGTVEEAVVITDKMSGRSKGFGFVTMSTEEEAQAAISELDGKMFEDREIRVAIAEERKDTDRKPFNRNNNRRFNSSRFDE